MGDAELIRQLFAYDSEAGCFTSLVRRGKRWPPGQIAGTLDPSNGYRKLRFRGRQHFEHRLVWLWVHGEWPAAQVDHINGNRSDNRIANLRLATARENSRNAGMSRNNTSGYKGVFWERGCGKWRASITVNRKTIHLGVFVSAPEAHAAYCAAAKKYHGEFANTGTT